MSKVESEIITKILESIRDYLIEDANAKKIVIDRLDALIESIGASDEYTESEIRALKRMGLFKDDLR